MAITSVSGSSCDAEFCLIFLGDFLAQAGDAVADAVAMVARIACGLGEFFHDRFGRGIGGVSHAQIDDVDAGHALFVFHLVDATEKVGRKAKNSRRNFNFERLVVHGVLNCSGNNGNLRIGRKTDLI